MVDLQLLADGEVEVARDEPFRQLPREIHVALQVGDRARAPAFVSLRVSLRDADGERRIGLEAEMTHVIVVDDDEHRRREPRDPVLHRPRAIEPDLPARREALGETAIVLEPHGRRVRDAEAADDARHQDVLSGRPDTRRGHRATISSTETPT